MGAAPLNWLAKIGGDTLKTKAKLLSSAINELYDNVVKKTDIVGLNYIKAATADDLKNKVPEANAVKELNSKLPGGSNNSKANLFTDGEGGNLRLISPNGNHVEMDMHDNEMVRIYAGTPTNEVTGTVTWSKNDTINLSSILSHLRNTKNPHSVTKAQVGLGNCDNTADNDKNVKHAKTAESAGSATLATIAKFLGEGVNKYNTGNGVNPIYISNGLPTRSNSTVGSADTPVYLNNGNITSTGKNFSNYLPLSGGTIKGKVIVEGNQHAVNFRALDNNDAFVVAGSSSNIVRLCGSQIQCNNTAVNANVAIYASAFSQTSSRRYKENIEDLTLEDAQKLLELRPVTYDYINKANGTGCQGLIAEEVDEIMKYPVIYNDEGQPDGIDYSKFVPSLIKLVQIQQNEIDELKQLIKNK